MYLKELYQYSKGWFVVVALFIVAQLVNNIRQDVSISPVYQYGMYSAYISPKKFYNVFEIRVNGKILEPKDFSPQQWDNITLPLKYYSNSKCNNDSMYHRDIKRLSLKLHIITDSSKFIYPFDLNSFMNWYRPYLSSIINEKILLLQVSYALYQFDSSFHKSQSGPFIEICN